MERVFSVILINPLVWLKILAGELVFIPIAFFLVSLGFREEILLNAIVATLLVTAFPVGVALATYITLVEKQPRPSSNKLSDSRATGYVGRYLLLALAFGTLLTLTMFI